MANVMTVSEARPTQLPWVAGLLLSTVAVFLNLAGSWAVVRDLGLCAATFVVSREGPVEPPEPFLPAWIHWAAVAGILVSLPIAAGVLVCATRKAAKGARWHIYTAFMALCCLVTVPAWFLLFGMLFGPMIWH